MGDKSHDWLIEVPEITEEEARSYQIRNDLPPTQELERYADDHTIRRYNGYLYFSAGNTPGQVCSGEMLDYMVPVDDVIDRGQPKHCFSTNVIYRKIRYFAGA